MWEQTRFVLDTIRLWTSDTKKSSSFETHTQSWESCEICLIDNSDFWHLVKFENLRRSFLTLCPTSLYLQFDLLSLPIKGKIPCHLPPWGCLFVTIFGIFMLITKQCSWQALKITAIQIWLKVSGLPKKTKIDVSRCQQYLGRSDKKCTISHGNEK